MAKIPYKLADGKLVELEVNEDFAVQFADMEHRESLVELKETRRHQSLDKSLEHGWDVVDETGNIEVEFERKEIQVKLHKALKILTEKQRFAFLSYVLDDMSFREIGNKLGISKEMARKHYLSAVKKIKKFFENRLSKSISRAY